jgi:hypothetical protein
MVTSWGLVSVWHSEQTVIKPFIFFFSFERAFPIVPQRGYKRLPGPQSFRLSVLTNDMQRNPLSFNEDISVKQASLAFWIGLNDRSLEDHLDHILWGETLFDRMLHSMRPDGKVAFSDP